LLVLDKGIVQLAAVKSKAIFALARGQQHSCQEGWSYKTETPPNAAA